MQKILAWFLLVTFMLTSCAPLSPWVKRNRPWTAELIEGAAQVRVTPEADESIVLEHARLVPSTNEIRGVPVGSTSIEEVGFDLDDLERLETRDSMDSDVEDHILGEFMGYIIAFVVGLIVVGSLARDV